MARVKKYVNNLKQLEGMSSDYCRICDITDDLFHPLKLRICDFVAKKLLEFEFSSLDALQTFLYNRGFDIQFFLD